MQQNNSKQAKFYVYIFIANKYSSEYDVTKKKLNKMLMSIITKIVKSNKNKCLQSKTSGQAPCLKKFLALYSTLHPITCTRLSTSSENFPRFQRMCVENVHNSRGTYSYTWPQSLSRVSNYVNRKKCDIQVPMCHGVKYRLQKRPPSNRSCRFITLLK